MTQNTDTAGLPPAPQMMTVAEFCAKYRLGRTKYQEMKRRRETPEEVRIGNRLLILPEAEAAWLAAAVERTRRLEQDRFAAAAPTPPAPARAPAPTRPPARTFASGKKIGRPRKTEPART